MEVAPAVSSTRGARPYDRPCQGVCSCAQPRVLVGQLERACITVATPFSCSSWPSCSRSARSTAPPTSPPPPTTRRPVAISLQFCSFDRPAADHSPLVGVLLSLHTVSPLFYSFDRATLIGSPSLDHAATTARSAPSRSTATPRPASPRSTTPPRSALSRLTTPPRSAPSRSTAAPRPAPPRSTAPP